MQWTAAVILIVTLCASSALAHRSRASNKTDEEGRKARLSLFNIVRFPNEPCEATGNRNGTCYTEQECEAKDGTNSGSCANGYGVCCTFSLGCGDMSRENCTYFESTSATGGTCRATICMNNKEVCQLRLDFNTFSITGPSTSTMSYGGQAAGEVLAGITSRGLVTTASQCNTDTFSVTNPGGPSVPVICGTNTGEHMYIPASTGCNDLVFQMNNPAVTTAVAGSGAALSASARQWNIKITQIGCTDTNKAPAGCTQYFYGNGGSGTVRSFNYEGGIHLARQKQNICIRRERGNCRICWSAQADIDVMLSGITASMAFNTAGSCCGYGDSGTGSKGYDCLIIPGFLTKSLMAEAKTYVQCGRSKGLVSGSTVMSATLCSDRVPFSIQFLSDDFEDQAEAQLAKGNKGFRLSYWQTSNGC